MYEVSSLLINFTFFFMSSMDSMVTNEAIKHGMKINEISRTRLIISNLEGVIFEISLS